MVDQWSVAWSSGPREAILIVKTNSRPQEIKVPCFTVWSIRLDHGTGPDMKREWPGVRTLPSIKAVCRCASVNNHRHSEQWIQYYFLTEFVACIQPGRYRNVKDLTSNTLRFSLPSWANIVLVASWSLKQRLTLSNHKFWSNHVQTCSSLQQVVWLAERTSMESTDRS